MSRDISYCEAHGEYMEFGPYYDCQECRDEREAKEPAKCLSDKEVILRAAEMLTYLVPCRDTAERSEVNNIVVRLAIISDHLDANPRITEQPPPAQRDKE